jgi:hypothetical protein
MHIVRLLSSIVALSLPLAAQTAPTGVLHAGTSCADAAGITPSLEFRRDPSLGVQFELVIAGPANGTALILMGTPNSPERILQLNGGCQVRAIGELVRVVSLGETGLARAGFPGLPAGGELVFRALMAGGLNGEGIEAASDALRVFATPSVLPLTITPGISRQQGGPHTVPGALFPSTALGSAILTQVGPKLVVSNIGSSGLDGVSFNSSLIAGQILTQGATIRSEPTDLSQNNSQITFNACEYFGIGVSPPTRFGLTNTAGIITLTFSLDTPPMNCVDVLMLFRDQNGALIASQTCPAGNLATMTPSGILLPRVIRLGVSTSVSNSLYAGFNNPATFTFAPSHPHFPSGSVANVILIQLVPSGCSGPIIFQPVNCLDVRARDMNSETITETTTP